MASNWWQMCKKRRFAILPKCFQRISLGGLKVSPSLSMKFLLKAFLHHIKFLGPLENFRKSDGNFVFNLTPSFSLTPTLIPWLLAVKESLFIPPQRPFANDKTKMRKMKHFVTRKEHHGYGLLHFVKYQFIIQSINLGRLY